MSSNTADSLFLDALERYPGAVLELTHGGEILQSNGRLDKELGEPLIGRSLSDLLEESSLRRWTELTGRPRIGCRYCELVFELGAVRSFLVLDHDQSGEPKLGLIECGSQVESERLISELTAINTDLVNAHRELAKKSTELDHARQEAATQTKDREELIRIVSHDLRAPLNVIVLKSALLEQPSIAEEARSHHLAGIRKAVNQAEQLIQDLSDAAAIEAGRFRIDSQPIEIESLVADACAAVKPLAAGRRLQIATEVESRVTRIEGDRRRLLQVLENLLGNAVKFTVDEDTIELKVVGEENRILISVTDHGPGIEASERDRVFDRYWTSARAGQKGSGLGLAIARGIVEAHGGEIWIDTKVERGTTFVVALPIASREGVDSTIV